MLFRHGTYGALNITLSSRKGTTSGKVLTSLLFWKGSGWRLELEQLILDSRDRIFQPFGLCDLEESSLPRRAKHLGNAPWLRLVHFFPTTEYMYLTHRLAVRIAPALQELTGSGVTEVLPVLRNIFRQRLDPLGPV